MRQLLINLNNTNTTLAIAEGDRIQERQRIPTAKLLQAENLVHRWAGDCHQAVLCSVVPGRSLVFTEWLGDRLVRITPDLDLGFDLSLYPGSHTLGADRIANTTHACQIGRFPAVVIDFGTAITFDVLDETGRFRGGVIAPGISAFVDYLHEHTAQLPRCDFAPPQTALADNTAGALQAGAFHGLTGALREILSHILKEGGWAKDQVFCVATGGYCELMNSSMPGTFDAVDPDFTLHGIRLIGERNPR